jgi:two-component system capsular synthesis response regulator RcsB
MIRVALLDDHPAVLAGMRRLIQPAREMEVVAVASNELALARQLDGQRPDILITEYALAHGDGRPLSAVASSHRS